MRSLASSLSVLVGLLFIFSGFVKAVDPLGFSYKLEEYFIVFGTNFLIPTALVQSLFICAFEILLGTAMVLRFDLKRWSWVAVGMIVFFTFLTGITILPRLWGEPDLVTDCGCFGNAIPLDPLQSFIKDIILLVCVLIVWQQRKTLQPLVHNKYIGHGLTYGAGITSALISIYGLLFLPLIDFRAYSIGSDISEGRRDGRPPTVVSKMGMEKDGEEIFIDVSQWSKYNTEGWKSNSKTETTILDPGTENSIKDFDFLDEYGNDITEEILAIDEYYFLVLSKDIVGADKEGLRSIAHLVKHSKMKAFGLSPSSDSDIEAIRHETQSAYPFYGCDEKAVKTAIRSNPGLILMKKNVVIGKWHYNSVPDAEEIKNWIK